MNAIKTRLPYFLSLGILASCMVSERDGSAEDRTPLSAWPLNSLSEDCTATAAVYVEDFREDFEARLEIWNEIQNSGSALGYTEVLEQIGPSPTSDDEAQLAFAGLVSCVYESGLRAFHRGSLKSLKALLSLTVAPSYAMSGGLESTGNSGGADEGTETESGGGIEESMATASEQEIVDAVAMAYATKTSSQGYGQSAILLGIAASAFFSD